VVAEGLEYVRLHRHSNTFRYYFFIKLGIVINSMDKPIEVILVDEQDRAIGTGEKLEAHKRGLLHRAFSIFIFNTRGEMLIQRRAQGKYHSGGLWSNACCSHPRPGEDMSVAVHRRLQEEMSIDCELEEKFTFIYKVAFDNDMTEYEFLHVFSGICDVDPIPNPDEVDDMAWIDVRELKRDVDANPARYTYWFREALSRLLP